MATEVLTASIHGKAITHTADHDAESLAYVICYTVLRRCIILADKGDKEGRFPDAKNLAVHKLLMKSYKTAFGAASLPALRQSRLENVGHFNWQTAVWWDEEDGGPWMTAYGPQEALFSLFESLRQEANVFAGTFAGPIIDRFKTGKSGKASQPTASSTSAMGQTSLTTFDKLKVLLDNALQYVDRDQVKVQIPENEGPVEEEERELLVLGLRRDEEEEVEEEEEETGNE